MKALFHVFQSSQSSKPPIVVSDSLYGLRVRGKWEEYCVKPQPHQKTPWLQDAEQDLLRAQNTNRTFQVLCKIYASSWIMKWRLKKGRTGKKMQVSSTKGSSYDFSTQLFILTLSCAKHYKWTPKVYTKVNIFFWSLFLWLDFEIAHFPLQ